MSHRILRTALLAAAAVIAPQAAQADELREAVAADMPGLMELYRDLHANPELSFQEHRTAAKLAGLLRDMDFDVTEGVGQTGVVALMENGPGPVVMLRADMDGLPVTEDTGLPFASTKRGTPASGVESGIMHACGHDTHMASLIGAAQVLTERRDRWSGTLMLILQPAEEIGEGALAMLEDGLFERFAKPDYALAMHDAAQYPAGQIAYSPGYALANVDSVDITVKGVGGHGAYPHTTKDPVVLASAIVMKLQTLVSRETSPLDPAVVTVGSFHAGAKHNVIPAEAKLQLTVRSYSDATRKALIDGIARIAKGEAMAAGLPEDLMPIVEQVEGYTPATYNNPEFTEDVVSRFTQRFGPDRVAQVPSVMGGEDFGRFRRADPDEIQSLIFWIGGVPADDIAAAERGEKTLPSLHSAYWAPEADKVIATGAEALSSAALDLLRPQ